RMGDPVERGVGVIEKVSPARRDTAPHARQLAAALGVTKVLPDSGSCIGRYFDDCRKGDAPGVMAFSPALVDGNKAKIRLHIWYRDLFYGRMVSQTAE